MHSCPSAIEGDCTVKASVAVLFVICVMYAAWSAVPASAQVLYDNGPLDGHGNAWQINGPYTVLDSFLIGDPSTITGFDFYVWAFHGDTPLTVDWEIIPFQPGGFHASGTSNLQNTYIFTTFDLMFDIDKETVTGLDLHDVAPGEYWLSLYDATTAGNRELFWDENSGVGCKSGGCPSMAQDSAYGTIPSESFDITGTSGVGQGTPEPGSILLLGSGVIASWIVRGKRRIG